MDNIVLTVCIVAYNQKYYIEKCLESIVNQKTKYLYKVIISDDASTDGTSEICSEYAKKYPLVKHVRHEGNIGAYENFKYAHRQAETKYISHCDGDDFWAEGKIEAQIDFLEKNPDCSAVYSNATVINEDGSVYGLFNNGGQLPCKINSGYLLEKSNFLNNSSMTYRTSLIGDIFNSDEKVIDYRVHIALAKMGFLGYIKDTLAFYRRNANGGLCSTQPSTVVKLVHEARLEGLRNSKLSLHDYSKIKANAWYGKLTSYFRKNNCAYAQHSEVSSLIVEYCIIQALYYFVNEISSYALIKGRNKLSNTEFSIMCRR